MSVIVFFKLAGIYSNQNCNGNVDHAEAYVMCRLLMQFLMRTIYAKIVFKHFVIEKV